MVFLVLVRFLSLGFFVGVLILFGGEIAVAGQLKMISLVLFVYFCFVSLFLIGFLVEVGILLPS